MSDSSITIREIQQFFVDAAAYATMGASKETNLKLLMAFVML